LHVDGTVDELSPLAHPDKANSSAERLRARACMLGLIESSSIVGDRQHQQRITACELHVHVARGRMLRHVVECLLDHPVQMCLDVRIHPDMFHVRTLKIGGDVERFRPLVYELTDRGHRTQIEGHWPQLTRHEVELRVELVDNRLCLRDTASKPVVAQRIGKQVELETQCRDLLPDVVVKIARDSVSLFVLNGNEPARQRRVFLRRNLAFNFEHASIGDVDDRREELRVFVLSCRN
jgi:hypothetical protein